MIHFPTSQDSRYSLNHYINRSWFIYFRCLYLTYCVFLANMYILIEGFSFGVLLFYSFKHAETENQSFIGKGKGIQLSAYGIVVVGTMMLSTLLSKGVEFLFIIWKKDQYSEISRRVLSFIGIRHKLEEYQFFDFMIQLFFILFLEIIPLLSSFVILIINVKVDLTFGLNCLFSFGSIAALSLILIWWIFSFIANYKRLFMFCLRKGKSFNNLAEAISEGPVKKRYFFPNDIVIDSASDEIVPLDMETNESRDVAVKKMIKKQRNIFVVLYIYLWRHPIRITLPKLFRGADPVRSIIVVRPKHIYFTIISIILVLFVILTGVFNLKMIFIVSSVALSCCLFDFIINRIIYIPKHSPNRQRLKSSWAKDGSNFLLHRFIAVFEEVYFLSPSIIYGIAKMGLYGHALLITICLQFHFYGGFTIFLPSLFGCALIVILYASRFNLKRFGIIIQYLFKAIIFRESEPIISEDENTEILNESMVIRSRDRSNSVNDTINEITRLLYVDDDDTTYSEEEQKKKGHLHVHYESEILRFISVSMVILLIIISCIVLFFVNLFYLGILSALMFVFCLFTVSFIVFRRYEKSTAPIWNAFFYLFVIFIGVIFVMGSIQTEPEYSGNFATTGHYIFPEKYPYDVCDSKWEGFNIIDYAFWAHLAYEQELYAIQDFETWFPDLANTSYDMKFYSIKNGPVFYDLHLKERNMSVIGIRGTNSFLDVIQDLYLWKEIVFLQIASIVGPFSNFWPSSLTVEIVNAIAKVEKFIFPNYSYDDSDYYNLLDKHLTDVLKTRNAVIVGHSLGGGLAGIIGSKHKRTVVTFSAPGIVYISKKFGLTIEDANRIAMNIKPNNDIVTSIDLSGGSTQQIDCKLNFLDCHRLTNTIKTLIQSCGNLPLGRYFRDMD